MANVRISLNKNNIRYSQIRYLYLQRKFKKIKQHIDYEH